MDILYYSNYCKHSQKILQTLSKNNLTDKISFICIDKRIPDEKTNQVYIYLENGSKVIMPPNLNSVPALLLIKESYRLIVGDEIISYIEPKVGSVTTKGNSEPTAFHLGSGSGGSNIVSEQFTFYNMSPEELGTKGRGGQRQLYNYVPASQDIININTPPDSYRPDKVSNSVTIDSLQQQRNEEIGKMNQPNPLATL